MAPQSPLETDAFDRDVRMFVFGNTAETGKVPAIAEVAEGLQRSRADVEESLRRLAAGRVLVLAPNNMNIWMANPFSAVATNHRVYANGRQYYGSCIWDALGIPAALGADAGIETQCGDCGTAMSLEVRGGALVKGQGIIHIGVPAARWWDNIGYT
ncbi:MAG: organomercurial lyase [Armatimonadota bacterium]